MSGVVRILTLYLFTGLLASNAFAAGAVEGGHLDLTQTGPGLLALVIFVLAYGFVIAEEMFHLRKSKPVMIAAGVI
jgi:hypothetical protein